MTVPIVAPDRVGPLAVDGESPELLDALARALDAAGEHKVVAYNARRRRFELVDSEEAER